MLSFFMSVFVEPVAWFKSNLEQHKIRTKFPPLDFEMGSYSSFLTCQRPVFLRIEKRVIMQALWLICHQASIEKNRACPFGRTAEFFGASSHLINTSLKQVLMRQVPEGRKKRLPGLSSPGSVFRLNKLNAKRALPPGELCGCGQYWK
jgi:hypothetical protein